LEGEVFFNGHEGLRRLGDCDHAGAVAVDLGGHKLLGAVRQSYNRNHGRNANHHAQQGKNGAHFVRPKRLQREFEGLSQFHEVPDFSFQL